MATFFSNTTLWYWGSTAYPVTGTLTGNVSRSGNTVTLSGLNLSLSWPAGAWGSYPVSISVNGTNNSTTLASGTGSWGLSNTSFGVSATQTSASIGWSTSDGYSGAFTVTFPSGATGPSGGSCSFVSSTWNSITIKGKVTNWGTGYSNPSRHFGVGGSTITSSSGGRREENVDGSATTDATVTINNSDSALDGGINIRGCLAYRAYMWYGTSVGSSTVPDGGSWTTRYTPPAPLQSLSVTSQTYVNNTQTSVAFSTTGGNSTNNNNVNVTTQYRYKVGSGSWSSWTAIGSAATPWTAKTWTLTLTAGASVTVETRQVYQSQASETKSLTFTVYRAPYGQATSMVSSTTSTITIRGSLTSYGSPLNTSATNQGIAIALIKTNEASPIALDNYDFRWDWAVHNSTALSGNATIGDSDAGSTAGFTGLEANTIYYPYIHGYNGTWVIQSSNSRAWFAGSAAVCTAPRPVDVTLMDIEEDLRTATETATLHFTQNDINLTTGSSLTPQYRYTIDGGATYSAWEDLDTDEPDGTFTIEGLPFETTVTVQTRTLYFLSYYAIGQDVTFTTDPNPHVIGQLTWTFDDLRRKTITWNITVNGSFTKTVDLAIKSHTVNLITDDTATTGTATESLPDVYKPNETLSYTITVRSDQDVVIETKTGSITMPRPIIGMVIDGEGTKRYITDIVKYGGTDTTNELCYDYSYNRFRAV